MLLAVGIPNRSEHNCKLTILLDVKPYGIHMQTQAIALYGGKKGTEISEPLCSSIVHTPVKSSDRISIRCCNCFGVGAIVHPTHNFTVKISQKGDYANDVRSPLQGHRDDMLIVADFAK